MTTHADPPRRTQQQTALRELITMRSHSEKAAESIQELLKAIWAGQEPARLTMQTLTAAAPIARDETGADWASVGVINQNAVTVMLGIGGIHPTVGSRAISCPPNGALILPVSAGDLELGADPAGLLGGDALVWVLRFRVVQPFFLGVM